jgi:hypothetical protein
MFTSIAMADPIATESIDKTAVYFTSTSILIANSLSRSEQGIQIQKKSSSTIICGGLMVCSKKV